MISLSVLSAGSERERIVNLRLQLLRKEQYVCGSDHTKPAFRSDRVCCFALASLNLLANPVSVRVVKALLTGDEMFLLCVHEAPV